MAPAAPSTNSGIQKLSNGESVIPSSTRADGSVRKEIRVKPGYKPPEDVEVYKNRTAEAWKHRGKGGVPGAAVAQQDQNEDGSLGSANKNAKRREARKKAAAIAAEHGSDDQGKAEQAPQALDNTDVGIDSTRETPDPEVEQAKEARKLAKKLRQARELQKKEENGDDLLPDQFAKVIKINELVRQLDRLGFDSGGQKKDRGTESAAKVD